MSRNGNKDQPLLLRRDLAKSRKERDKLGLNFIKCLCKRVKQIKVWLKSMQKLNFIKCLCKRVKQSLIEIHAEIEDGFLENVSLRVS